jgi:hypothetical protein
MKKLLFILSTVATLSASAQKEITWQKPEFYSANQAGLLEGAAGSAFLVQTINGFAYKSWAAGLGVGIDKYKERSIPIFIQVSRKISNNKMPFYLYADGGINLLWPQPEESQWQGWHNRNNKGGLYFDGGLQYQYAVSSRQAILVSFGYSEKRYSWHTSIPAYCIDGSCPAQTNSWYYTCRRIAIKAGWKF